MKTFAENHFNKDNFAIIERGLALSPLLDIYLEDCYLTFKVVCYNSSQY